MMSSRHGPDELGHSCATMEVFILQRKTKTQVCVRPENLSEFGSKTAIRLCEDGIASNRGSARHGEYVPGLCTHRPSRSES